MIAIPEANIRTAPAILNTADKAIWAIGWNECRTVALRQMGVAMSALPELPEPAFRLTWNARISAYYVNKPNIGNTDCYTADQMHAAISAERARVIEECAAEADRWLRVGPCAAYIAAAIRGML